MPRSGFEPPITVLMQFKTASRTYFRYENSTTPQGTGEAQWYGAGLRAG
jgi:hypothetical protein